MLRRYKIYRGARPKDDPLPKDVRQDTRKHTRHCLRPAAKSVEKFIASPTEQAWQTLKKEYLALLRERFASDPRPFQELAALAETADVSLGCNCPTKKNPDVNRCHTVLALRFMKKKFPGLKVVLP